MYGSSIEEILQYFFAIIKKHTQSFLCCEYYLQFYTIVLRNHSQVSLIISNELQIEFESLRRGVVFYIAQARDNNKMMSLWWGIEHTKLPLSFLFSSFVVAFLFFLSFLFLLFYFIFISLFFIYFRYKYKYK